MNNSYFTLTATKHYFGTEFLKPDMQVFLKKEPDNAVDSEAIQVTLPGLGVIGYVANSTYSVLGECMSAGRLYDRIGDTAEGTVLYVLERGVVCRLTSKEAE